jgi:hypothetical protein
MENTVDTKKRENVVFLMLHSYQARTERSIHGLPRVSCGPAMPNPYTPCGRATPQMAGRAACGHLLSHWIPLPVRACISTIF